MKKYLAIILILFLTGCNKSVTLNINNNNVTNIIYDNINLVSNDYEVVINEINNNVFYELIDKSIKGKKLELKTNEKSYSFEVVNNYLIYTVDNMKYFTSTNNLNDFLDKTVDKYNDDSFYTVDIINNYNINNADYFINIDNTNKYVVINTKLNLYDFKVNKVSLNNDKYVDLNLVNTVDNIDSNKYISISTYDPSELHISFLTPYNFKVNIYYDGDFIKTISQIVN